MKRFINELRRREVLRTAGLYVGICWIVIEASSILLPTFDAPEWMLQGIILAAVAGFPIMLVLAWFFDVTDRGIEKQADPTDTIVAPAGRGDYLVIGVLTVALVFSVYLNITRSTGSVDARTLEPVSVLIADFDNRTGDSVFDGSLEKALQIGIESAPFITTFSRDRARQVAVKLHMDGQPLDAEAARLVSVREGIDLVLSGTIVPRRRGYELVVRVIDAATGEWLADPGRAARSKAEVLQAVGEISETVRKALGDEPGDGRAGTIETLEAASLETVQAYTQAELAALRGDYEGSLALYASAVEQDPNFGRALSGSALSLFTLGRTGEAEAKWKEALSKMGTMTERERLRTLGLYYVTITEDYEKAIETYAKLVERYPADSAGRNGLATASLATLEFETALQQGREALKVYPKNEVLRSNHAFYAMYAGEFDTARSEAEALLGDNSDYFRAWLPVAMAANRQGDWSGAESAYARMAVHGVSGASLANLGLADLALFRADSAGARRLLESGIAADIENRDSRSAAIKQVMLAKARLIDGDSDNALRDLKQASAASTRLSVQVPAALAMLELGDTAGALEIAAELGNSVRADSRAYSRLIEGAASLRSGEHIEAVERFSEGIALADLWLLRYYRGIAYFENAAFVEALDEFRAADERVGEATAVFLDDLPTWRVTALLPYWAARTEAELGMQTESQQRLRAFVDYRMTGPEAADARARLP